MIKSSMNFLDVLFPLNLGTLTYRCPEEFSGIAEPGMIVSAPLKNKILKGIILGRSLKTPSRSVKNILTIHGNTPLLSSKMIKLLTWMSEYYLVEQGIVLKNMLPKEAFTRVKRKKRLVGKKRIDYTLHAMDINGKVISSVVDSIKKKTYMTFLLHAPSSVYEYLFVITVLAETKNAILLIPEITLANALHPFFAEKFGERVCLLHGEMSKGRRSETIERILSGSSDIILGTRSAIFAPLKHVSFIAVFSEHNSSYKQKEGFRYSGRDVAVMRGYLERSTVLLSSLCPSLESFSNCKSGKYTLIKPEGDMKKPKVRVVDMVQEKLLRPYLTKKAIDASRRYIKNDKKVMFLINRRGYSTLLQCKDCTYIQECPNCRIPLVFHKQDFSLKCHYCGYTSDLPDNCPRCKSYKIELLGAGTQRIQEDLEDLLGIKPLRLDSDRVRNASRVMRYELESIFRDDLRIIVGTKFMTRRLGTESISKYGGFSLAVILNTDLFLNLPDFRSAEKAYQEISYIIDTIESQGEVFIQTRMPRHYLFKCLKNYDYNVFFREELSRRKSLHYPPYSRLILIKCISKRVLSQQLLEIIKWQGKEVEILGPSVSKDSHGRHEFKLLLKSPVRVKLQSVARIFLDVFKDAKDVKIKVDVDPISM